MLAGCAFLTPTLDRSQDLPLTDVDYTVEAEPGDGPETRARILLRASHLPLPDTVASGARTYVLWGYGEDGTARNLGVLDPNEALQAELRATSPFFPRRLSVTAERSADATRPGGEPLLWKSLAR